MNKKSKDGKILIIRPWITVKGKRVYPKNGKYFAFYVDKIKSKS